MLDKEKKRFHEMAEKDKARYDLEMQNYVPPKGVVLGRGKKRKQIKDPNAPKRSLYVYNLLILSFTHILSHTPSPELYQCFRVYFIFIFLFLFRAKLQTYSSAFFWFCNDERGKVKAVNPEYGVGDIAKELGKKWSDVEPATKSKYEAMAENDKKRYERVSCCCFLIFVSLNFVCFCCFASTLTIFRCSQLTVGLSAKLVKIN